jgi:hypothetical protein
MLDRRTFACGLAAAAGARAQPPTLSKLGDSIIYSDDKFYSCFPSVVRRKDGELIVAFRRAPNRRLLGDTGYTHTDSNSYLVLVRSRDGGASWTTEPELIYAHPYGGSQDPCMVQLSDGSIVCASYLWTWTNRDSKTKATYHGGQFAYQGGYVLRSLDGAKTWKGPFYPPPVPGRGLTTTFGSPLPAYNRGAMCQGKDGLLYWIVAYGKQGQSGHTDVHLMISSDRAETWRYSCVAATDVKAQFNETSLYETPKGDLVAFIRTAGLDDHAVVARSRDRGKSFESWKDAGWQGHPHHAIRLEDNRVLLVYGYRHPPFGIRARVLDPECTDFAAAPEFVIRDDGGGKDLGYPWAVALPGRKVLVTYYFNREDGVRHIAGSLLRY